MRDKRDFFNILNSIEGADADAYHQLVGDFDFSRYVLKINSLEAAERTDNLLVVRVPQDIAVFPPHLFNTPVRRTALEDLLTRRLAEEIDELAHFNDRGVARRRLSISVPGQKMLPRTSLFVAEEYVEARIYVVLPVEQGKVAAEAARTVFFEELPEIVNQAMLYCNLDEQELDEYVDLMEDADQIRQLLGTRGCVSFIASESMPARIPGLDLPDYEAAQFLEIEPGLQSEFETPNRGAVSGLGIPQGLTVILGGPYSGRSALVQAIAQGIYNHVPGDGRELCVSVPDTVYIPADAGRPVQRVDISSFVPQRKDGAGTEAYSAEEADACAAQAASTVESLEIGARVLVYDEADSSAAFLAGDSRLRELLADESAEIHSLASRARQMIDELGISIVVGGSTAVAEFLPVADQVYRVNGNQITDVTQAAASAVSASPSAPDDELARLVERSRWVVPSSVDPSVGHEDQRVEVPAPDLLEFGRSLIDLEALRQLADEGQALTIGRILVYARRHYLDEGRPIREVLDLIDRDLSTEGLETLTRDLEGNLARPRRYEIAAALNRLETLRISNIVD